MEVWQGPEPSNHYIILSSTCRRGLFWWTDRGGEKSRRTEPSWVWLWTGGKRFLGRLGRGRGRALEGKKIGVLWGRKDLSRNWEGRALSAGVTILGKVLRCLKKIRILKICLFDQIAVPLCSLLNMSVWSFIPGLCVWKDRENTSFSRRRNEDTVLFGKLWEEGLLTEVDVLNSEKKRPGNGCLPLSVALSPGKRC